MKKFDQFCSYLEVLKTAKDEDLKNTFIVSGIIDKFFVQFELGWKVLKEFLRYEGRIEASSGSPREIIKAAYKAYDFLDKELWLKMLAERNNMAHLYDEAAANELCHHIIEDYTIAFEAMKTGLQKLYFED